MIYLDPGVLAPAPVLEFGGFQAVAKVGGVAVLPWRAAALEAGQAEVRVLPTAEDVDAGAVWRQALVHLQKSSAATAADIAAAWVRLEPGGRLLFYGTNELGAASAVKRLEASLAQRGRVVANRAHARVVAFTRGDGHSPVPPTLPDVPLYPTSIVESGGGQVLLSPAFGGFSAGKLDRTTTVLLESMASVWDTTTPRRIADIGCGIGHGAIAALRHWPDATAAFLDADARAIAAVRRNLVRLGLEARAACHWWDVTEPLPETGFDLALLNPPYHTGTAYDPEISRAMFRALPHGLAPGGRAWMAVNRRLPFREVLEGKGELRVLRDSGEFLFVEWLQSVRK